MTKQTLVSLGVAVAIVLGVAGLFYPKSVSQTVTQLVQGGGSPAGSTFNTAKVATIVWAPQSNSASTTALYNGDSSDRIITSAQYDCTGASFTAANAVAYLRFTAATTSAPTNSTLGSTNLVLDNNVGSSTAEVFMASTTPGSTVIAGTRRWASGSYLQFDTNATSTGLTCLIGVNYLAD